MRRVVFSLLSIVTLLLVSAGPATAAYPMRLANDRNAFGSYDCQVVMDDSQDGFKVLCNVDDRKCDGYGVYVGMAYYDGSSGASAPNPLPRITGNAGGCGSTNYGDYKRYSNGWAGTSPIVRIHFGLCVDRPGKDDYCYTETYKSLYYPVKR